MSSSSSEAEYIIYNREFLLKKVLRQPLTHTDAEHNKRAFLPDFAGEEGKECLPPKALATMDFLLPALFAEVQQYAEYKPKKEAKSNEFSRQYRVFTDKISEPLPPEKLEEYKTKYRKQCLQMLQQVYDYIFDEDGNYNPAFQVKDENGKIIDIDQFLAKRGLTKRDLFWQYVQTCNGIVQSKLFEKIKIQGYDEDDMVAAEAIAKAIVNADFNIEQAAYTLFEEKFFGSSEVKAEQESKEEGKEETKEPASQLENLWPENIRVCQWLDSARPQFKLEENILYIEQLGTGTLRCYFLDSASQKKMVKVPASSFLPKPQKLFEPPAQKTKAMNQFWERLGRLRQATKENPFSEEDSAALLSSMAGFLSVAKPAPVKPLARKRLNFTETAPTEGYTKSLDELNVFEGRNEDAKREQSLVELDEAIEREKQEKISKEKAGKEKEEEKPESELERYVLLKNRKKLKPQKVPNEATSSKKIRHINEEHKLKINGAQPKEGSYQRAANYHKLENNLVSYRTDPKTYLDSVKKSIGEFSEIPKRILRPSLNIDRLIDETKGLLESDEKLCLKLKADIDACIDQGEKEKLEKQRAMLESRIQEQKDDIDALEEEKKEKKISETVNEQEAAIKPEITAMQELFYDEDGHRPAPELEAIGKYDLASLNEATLYEARRKLISLRKMHSEFNEKRRPEFKGKALQLASFASSIENLDRLIEMVEKELSNRAWAAPAKSIAKRSKANRFASRSENSVVANTAHKRVRMPRKLAALDIDGTLYNNAFEISSEAAKAALSIKGDTGTVEAFTARDKAEFRENVVLALKNSIAAIVSSDQIKSEAIIKAIDGIKTEVIKRKLKKQYGITLSKICTLRDCMSNDKGQPRVLGSYYEYTLKKFEDRCCKQFQDELLGYIKSREFNEIILKEREKAFLALKDKIDEIAAKIVVDEPKCTATKGDLIAKRLKESKAARKSISEVFFLDDTDSHLHWVNHANWLGRFRAVPVSAVQAHANSAQTVFKEHNLLAQHEAQIQAQEGRKREPRAFSHFDNPIYLEYKRANIKEIFFKKVPKEIINFKAGPKEETLLHYVSRMGDLDCVKALLRSNEIDLYIQNSKGETFLQVTDQYGRTILHHATAEGNLGMVERLIEAGADVNAQDNNGLTALHHAVANGNLEMVAKLIDAGADVDAQDNNGLTALHHAVVNGDVDMVRALIILGARVDAQDNNGITALRHAVVNGDVDMVRALIILGAKVDAQDDNGLTALHYGAAEGDMDMVRALIAQGADVTIQDKEGNTPFDLLRPLLKLRIETLKALQDILVIIKKAIDKGFQPKISEAIKNSILATLEYTEFGRQYSTLLKADMDFWTPNIDGYTMQVRCDFCQRYIKFCIDSIDSVYKTSNLSMEAPQVSMSLPRSKRKKYQEATPQKYEIKKSHSEKKLYVLQKAGITEKRETAVIPVVISSNTQGRAIPDKQAKSYYNRADIKPTIECMDAYAAYPEVDFHDAPGNGIFYMPDSVYNDDETEYFFEVTEKDGFQVFDPIAKGYFSPYNRASKLCARFRALREHSSAKMEQRRVEAITTERVDIDVSNEPFLKKRKESISAVLNADDVKASESARNIRSLVNELGLNIIMPLDERRNKFLDLCQLAIEFDRVHSTSLFDDIVGIMSLENDTFTRDIAITIRSGLLHFAQNIDKRKQFIDSLAKFLINLRKGEITLEKFIVDCSKIGARSSISLEIEIESIEEQEHEELGKVPAAELKDDISSDDEKSLDIAPSNIQEEKGKQEEQGKPEEQEEKGKQEEKEEKEEKEEQDSPVEDKKPIVLSDVDETILLRDKSINEALLESLKGRDIYLFTDMIFSVRRIVERMLLIQKLKDRGFNVLGVITPADVTLDYVTEDDIQNSDGSGYFVTDQQKEYLERRAAELYPQIYPEELSQKDNTKIGQAFAEADKLFGKEIREAIAAGKDAGEIKDENFLNKAKAFEAKTNVAKKFTEEISREKGYLHPKACMLDHYNRHKPEQVGDVAVADDLAEVILAVKQVDHPNIKRIHVSRSRLKADYDCALAGDLEYMQSIDKALSQEILLAAVTTDDQYKAELALKQGADIHVVDEAGKTLLHHAAETNRQIVKFLVERGVDVHALDNSRKTALHYAPDPKLVEFLIAQGVKVNAVDNDRKTALYYASRRSQLKVVESLILQDADINAVDNDGKTTLHHMAEMGRLSVVKCLIAQCADTTVKDKDEKTYLEVTNAQGMTLLHHAAIAGDIDLVKYLIAQGADVKAKNKEGKTVLEVTNAQDMTLLHHAAIAGDIGLVEYLIAQGADVKAKNKEGKTALQCTDAKQLDLIAFLLQKDERLHRQSNETLLKLCHEAAMNLEEKSFDEVLDEELDLLERMATEKCKNKTEYQYFMEWKAVRSAVKETEGAVQASFKELDTAMQAFYVSAHSPSIAFETREQALITASAHVKSIRGNKEQIQEESAPFVDKIKGLFRKQQTYVARNKLVGAAEMFAGAAAMVAGSIGIVASFVAIPFTVGFSLPGLPASASLFAFGLSLFAKGQADYSDAKKEEKRINTLEEVSKRLEVVIPAPAEVEEVEVVISQDGCKELTVEPAGKDRGLGLRWQKEEQEEQEEQEEDKRGKFSSSSADAHRKNPDESSIDKEGEGKEKEEAEIHSSASPENKKVGESGISSLGIGQVRKAEDAAKAIDGESTGRSSPPSSPRQSDNPLGFLPPPLRAGHALPEESITNTSEGPSTPIPTL